MLHSDAGPSEKSRGDVYTIVVAGGSGIRFGERKQFLDLAGKSVLDRSVETAVAASTHVVIVVPFDVAENIATTYDTSTAIVARHHCDISVVAGGDSRAASVRAGLAALGDVDPEAVVLIHDAARPLATLSLYERVIAAVGSDNPAVVPAVALADTIRSIDGGVLDRDRLRAVQTPQAFRAETILTAHADDGEATDDASLVEASLGLDITIVEGETHNRKITTPFDMAAARAHLTNHLGSGPGDTVAKDITK